MSILIKHGGQAPSSHRKRVWHFGLMIWPPNKSSSPIGCPGKSECKAAPDWLKHFLSDYLCEALVSKSHPVHRKRQAKLGLLQQEKLRKGALRRPSPTPWPDFAARANQCSQPDLLQQSPRPRGHRQESFGGELQGLTLICPHGNGSLAGRKAGSFLEQSSRMFSPPPAGGRGGGEVKPKSGEAQENSPGGKRKKKLEPGL